jgi:hypothetical protein
MLILDRLISRSSRSLAATIGFVRAGGGRGCGGWSGSPDDDFARSAVSLPAFFYLSSKSTQRSRRTRSGAVLFLP